MKSKLTKKNKLKKNKLYIYVGINITYTILRFCYSNVFRFRDDVYTRYSNSPNTVTSDTLFVSYRFLQLP